VAAEEAALLCGYEGELGFEGGDEFFGEGLTAGAVVVGIEKEGVSGGGAGVEDDVEGVFLELAGLGVATGAGGAGVVAAEAGDLVYDRVLSAGPKIAGETDAGADRDVAAVEL